MMPAKSLPVRVLRSVGWLAAVWVGTWCVSDARTALATTLTVLVWILIATLIR